MTFPHDADHAFGGEGVVRLAPGSTIGNSGDVTKRRTGDGFMRCSDGHVRWGVFGAAGVVFVVDEADGPVVMLQKRSAMAHEGGTWSCAGGALDEGETSYEGALREATEEVGAFPGEAELLGEYAFVPATDWSYVTVVVRVAERFGESMNFETDAVGWFSPDDVERLPLHAGFAAAWPHLRVIVDGR
ncbi:MAG: NUDIX domain-containing protein [Ilumatobacter sp.]|uniref:NUDIX domain-containing protein n=1 Tax=Ilumatobacter sp. TaxID=1967498 RepID=UPI0039197A43